MICEHTGRKEGLLLHPVTWLIVSGNNMLEETQEEVKEGLCLGGQRL